MRLAYRRNQLAYPGGRNPGFDPAHIAAGGSTRWSAVATGNAFINLLNGKPTTVSGTEAANMTRIGPAVSGSTTAAGNTIANPTTTTPAALTLAAIIIPTVSSGANYLVSTSSSGTYGGNTLELVALVLKLYAANTTLVSSGLPALSLNVPYFVAVSCNPTIGLANFIVANLATGQIHAASVAQTTAFSAYTALGVIGGTTLGNSRYGSQVACAMVSEAYLSPGQLLAWAQNPWDFWYPPTVENLIFTSFKGGSLSPVTGALAVTEADDSISASGALVVNGLLSIIEGDDAITASAGVSVSGTLSITEANDTLVAAGYSGTITGTLSINEADDILSATGSVGSTTITGMLNVMEIDDALTSQAFVFNPAPIPPAGRIFNPGTEWQYFDRLIDSRRHTA